MTHGIREAFTYRKRHEHGTQHPLDTLQTKSGTCRDYALFMIEALRRLGIAARFVSGYLFIPGDRAHGYVGGGSTHAWVQVYLPSAGWIEFDPTNGIVGTRDLCASRWRAIRARRSRCTARISARPMRSSAWMSASMWFRWTREREA